MKKNDILLICILIVVAGVTYLFVNHIVMQKGGKVEVLVDGKVEHTFSLEKDMEYTIKTDDGDYNVLVINDNEVWISKADCPDQLCVHQHKISKVGESIICLPHKLVIRIADTEKSDLDAVAD